MKLIKKWPWSGEFAGRVIDGPWRGKHVKQRYPDFRVPIYQRMSVLDFTPETVGDTVTAIEQVQYRWVWSLGEWAMVY